MKRLLCVLMVMVMAVLMVPTIAGADDVYRWFFSSYTYRSVRVTSEGAQETVTAPVLDSTQTQGRTLLRWEDNNGHSCTPGEVIITKGDKNGPKIPGGTYNAVWGEPDPEPAPEPAPEPVEVVEEKKPEEPHVHAEEWVPGTPATCTSTGLTDGIKCKWCGEVLKAQTEIPKIDHVYSMWVPNGSGKHYASCLYCGNKIDAECQKVQLPIKSTSGAAVILCPVCGDCNGATATAVKGLKVGEGAPYRGTLRVWNIDAGDGNKYLVVSFDRFGKIMQPEGEVSVTLPDDMKGTTAGVISADGNVKTAQESNGTLKLDFTGSPVVVLKGN